MYMSSRIHSRGRGQILDQQDLSSLQHVDRSNIIGVVFVAALYAPKPFPMLGSVFPMHRPAPRTCLRRISRGNLHQAYTTFLSLSLQLFNGLRVRPPLKVIHNLTRSPTRFLSVSFNILQGFYDHGSDIVQRHLIDGPVNGTIPFSKDSFHSLRPALLFNNLPINILDLGPMKDPVRGHDQMSVAHVYAEGSALCFELWYRFFEYQIKEDMILEEPETEGVLEGPVIFEEFFVSFMGSNRESERDLMSSFSESREFEPEVEVPIGFSEVWKEAFIQG